MRSLRPVLLAVLVASGTGIVLLVAGQWHAGGNVKSGTNERAAGTHSDPSAGIPLSIPGLLGDRSAHVASRAAVVLHMPSGRMLSEHDSATPFPIASLTKLMSAMVALDHGIDLNQEVTILPEEFTIGGNLRIAPGEVVTARDLLYSSIVGSANNAALALARVSGLSRKDFVQEMNRKAVALGLEHTHFLDPSGLDPENMGSAYDVAQMAAVAFARYPLIRDAASRADYTLTTRNTHREHTVKNPNTLFQEAPGAFTVSKTGYLDEALYCLVLARELPDATLVIAVTVGHPSDVGSRTETLALLQEGSDAVLPETTSSR